MVGFGVDALWYAFMKSTGLYEIIPGFLCSLIAAVVVTLIDRKPSAEVEALFEESKKITE